MKKSTVGGQCLLAISLFVMSNSPALSQTTVFIDIKPNSCSNEIGYDEDVIEVLLPGTRAVSVDDLKASTIRLQGVTPKARIEDIGKPDGECNKLEADGLKDYILEFSTKEIIAGRNSGPHTLRLTALLQTGEQIIGTDNIKIKKKTSDCWTFSLEAGQELSTFNVEDSAGSMIEKRNAFSDPKTFVGLTASQVLLSQNDEPCPIGSNVKRKLVLEEKIRFGRANIEQEAMTGVPTDNLQVVREAETIMAEVSLIHDRWISKSEQTRAYLKGTLGFQHGDDDRLDHDQLDYLFLGGGLEYDNVKSRYHGSYMEFGTGTSERFDHERRTLKAETTLFVTLGSKETVKSQAKIDGWWRFLITMELDAGPGADDFRVLYGIQKALTPLLTGSKE